MSADRPTLDTRYWPPQASLRRNERPVVRWPDGARVAFWAAPNIEFYELHPPANPVRPPWPNGTPDFLAYSWRDYGNRVGAWRCLEVFERHGIVGSVSLNAAMCVHLPEVVEAFRQTGWELFCHGTYNTRYLFGQGAADELAALQTSCETIGRFSGRRVRGFLSPALTYTPTTFVNAKQAGIDYVFDIFNADVPLPLRPAFGRMLSVPYQVELNDFHVVVQGGASPARYVELFKRHFDRLYAEGASSGTVVSLPLHPYVIGSPLYIGALDEILAYIRNHDKVWCTTAERIADWYFEHYFDQAAAVARDVEERRP